MNQFSGHHRIFNVSSPGEFNELAIDLFRHQYQFNPVYKRFVDALKMDVNRINEVASIPFLPIDAFKLHKVVCGQFEAEAVFTSSGTTAHTPSQHYIASLNGYEESFLRGFELQYGSPADWCILALLPSYLEREGSSLVYMCKRLMELSDCPISGFYLNNYGQLMDSLNRATATGKKVWLIGVTYALLDLAEKHPGALAKVTLVETGGMKGRLREMVREEVHAILMQAFDLREIHSEYGMTELLSQAYATSSTRFNCPPWMRVVLRDPEDPLTAMEAGKTGGINVIDLANVHSCAFIATQDLGRIHPDGSFEVLGRFDHADVRGCNLLVST